MVAIVDPRRPLRVRQRRLRERARPVAPQRAARHRCSTGSSSRRSCATRSPRSAATTSRPAGSRPSCAGQGATPAETLPVHVIVNQMDDSDDVVVELVEIEQQTRQDARGARARAGAGDQGADPQPRPRDQEPARRHPRRGAAARDGGRVARADRVHPGHHQRGRSAAGRWSTGCSRRTASRTSSATSTSTRSASACAR